MSDEVEDLINNIADDFDAPDVEHIHTIAASRKQKRQAATRISGVVAIVFLIAGFGIWLNQPESTRMATFGDGDTPTESPAVASDSPPLVVLGHEQDRGGPLSEKSFGEWMMANRLRDDRKPSISLVAQDSDPTTNAVRLNLSAFPVDGSFEFFAVIYAECGPRLQYGLIDFTDDTARFRLGRTPDSEQVGFAAPGYDCTPPRAKRLGDLLLREFEILPTTSGLRLTNGTETVEFVFAGLEDTASVDNVDPASSAQRRLVNTPRWFVTSRQGIPDIEKSQGERIAFSDNQIAFMNCEWISYDILWNNAGFTVLQPTPIDPNAEVTLIGCDQPVDGIVDTPMQSGLEISVEENSNRTISLTSSEWQLTLSATGPHDAETRVYVSLPIDDAAALAESNGLEWRVVHVDGEEQRIDAALKPRRLNFTTQGGIVIHVQSDQEIAAHANSATTTTTTATVTTTTQPTSPSGSWTVRSFTVDGVELSDPTIIQTLRIDDEMVWGNDGCNSWSGTAARNGAELSFNVNGTSTAMLCLDGQVADDAFNAAVRRTTGWSIVTDGVLVLTGPGSQVELIPQK